MSLVEVLKAEPCGKPMVLDDLRKQVNTSSEQWLNDLIALTVSGCCILSSVSSDDGNSISMIQYIPSVVSDAATATVRTDEPVKAVKMCATRGRPRIHLKLKRVVVSHIRLPVWMVECLKDRGNSGRTVEQAVIKYLGLVAPSV